MPYPGKTFTNLATGSIPSHLWIVLSSSSLNSGKIVIVNITSQDIGDYSCVLNVGDHPFIHHPSYVYYAGARLVDSRQVIAQTGRLFFDHADMSLSILNRIRAGAYRSDNFEDGYLEILLNQNLIPESCFEVDFN